MRSMQTKFLEEYFWHLIESMQWTNEGSLASKSVIHYQWGVPNEELKEDFWKENWECKLEFIVIFSQFTQGLNMM